jgi:arylsulfatase A-like enzyme
MTSCNGADSEALAPQPNILLIVTDDQRRDMVGALGDARVQTPHLDGIAAEGFAFQSAYVAGAMHGAVCMPSRAMLLTGRHFRELPVGMVQLWAAPQDERGVSPVQMLPETFRAAGYRTFGTGKWHNGTDSYHRCFDEGAAIFFGGMADHLQTPIHDFDPSGAYPQSARRPAEGFSSEVFADATIDFLESRAGQEQPFFAWLSFTAPHDPRMAPAKFEALYPRAEIAPPTNFMEGHPYPIGDMKIRDEMLAAFPRTREEVSDHLAAYMAMVTHLDAQIGRVLAALETAGLADSTIVVVVGDNGLAVGQHGLLGKQNVYEHSAGVPMLLRGPGVPAGGRSDGACYVHDLNPTLCELAGLPIPETVTARSLQPVLRGSADAVRDSLVLWYDTDAVGRGAADNAGRLRALRKGRWKLIHNRFRGVETVRLYDLEADPWELHDLSADAARVTALRSELEDKLAPWGGTLAIAAD